MLDKIFSKRQRPLPDKFRYDFPVKTRNRILYCLKGAVENNPESTSILDSVFGALLIAVDARCLCEYGEIDAPPALHHEGKEAIGHFINCSEDRVLDFLEMFFQCRDYPDSKREEGVRVLNTILREEGIGYEFSPFSVTSSPTRIVGFPIATKKSNELLHTKTIMPALQFLAHPKFQVANKEMLEAHEFYRKGEFGAAINSCGQSLESTLKTICDIKGWPYNPDKDVLSVLVETCKNNGLFPTFYAPMFIASGTIRNKYGSHGKGPVPPHGDPGAEHAEHLIAQNSAHILLLAKLAKL